MCSGLPASTARVVYPGVRSEMFGMDRVGMPTPLAPDGSKQRPLKVCFAGLLMGSKGAHTLIKALITLQQQGVSFQASLAGDFQSGYSEQLERMLKQYNLIGAVQFSASWDDKPWLGTMPCIMYASSRPYTRKP